MNGMPPSKQAELILLAQAGDDASRDVLASSFIDMIPYVIRTEKLTKRTGLTHWECYSEGYIGIINAIRRFKPDRGRDVGSWVYSCIVYQILDKSKSEARSRARHSPLTVEPYREPRESDSRHEDSRHEDSRIIREFQRVKLSAVLERWGQSSLSLARDAAILSLFTGIDPRGPLDYESIGSLLSISRTRAHVLANRAFRLICAEFGLDPRTDSLSVAIHGPTRKGPRKKKC